MNVGYFIDTPAVANAPPPFVVQLAAGALDQSDATPSEPWAGTHRNHWPADLRFS